VLRQQLVDPDVRLEQRSSRRLGRVRREHELERGVLEAAAQLVLRYLSQQSEGFVERLTRRSGLARVLTPSPKPMVLLGRVGKLEVESERAQHLRLLAR
jgi:hypothetical protein